MEPTLDVEARLAAICIAASCLEGSSGEVLLPRDERGRELDELALDELELTRLWCRLYEEQRRNKGAWLVLAEAVMMYAVQSMD